VTLCAPKVRFAQDSPLEEVGFEPSVPVIRMYANTEIAADREQRSRKWAGTGENAENADFGTAA